LRIQGDADTSRFQIELYFSEVSLMKAFGG